MLLLSCLFVIFSASLQAQSSWKLWFEDDFTTQLNRWDRDEHGTRTVFRNYFSLDTVGDFRLESTFRNKGGEEGVTCGMIWGAKGEEAYYMMDLYQSKYLRFLVKKQEDEQAKVVEQWRLRTKNFRDSLRLVLVQRGEEWLFFFDKHLLGTVNKSPFFNGGIALFTEQKQAEIQGIRYYQKEDIMDEEITAPFQKINLGDRVNSSYTEKAPIISPDGQTLYFIVEGHPDGYGGQDIWYSEFVKGEWSRAKNIDHPLNNRLHNFVNAVSVDNQSLFLVNSYEGDVEENVLAMSTLTKDGWSLPKAIEIKDFDNMGENLSFSLSLDERVLIFSAQRPDSKGGRDLYVSFREEGGQYSSPINLGAVVNTQGHEHNPFLAADNQTLYFDTDGHPSHGGRDIFMVRRLDDTWQNWSTPQNLGPQVNGPGTDEGLTLSSEGEVAYWASETEGQGSLDLFRLTLPEKVRPRRIPLIRGKVVDCRTDYPIYTTLRIYSEEELVTVARTHPRTGEYALSLPVANYRFILDYNDSEFTLHDTLRIEAVEMKEGKYVDLPKRCFSQEAVFAETETDPLESMDKLLPEIEYILFDSDASELNAYAQLQVDTLVEMLLFFPQRELEIIGHSDSRGSSDYNQRLSYLRAETVYRYLLGRGISARRLRINYMGEKNPLRDNKYEKGRIYNRRVDFRFLD